MSKPIDLVLTLEDVRRVQLAAFGLSTPPEKPTGKMAANIATKQDVLAAIRGMGALQIDTIHVVSRSPYLVLWSRLGDYPPQWLDELLAEGFLFEYWAHAACYLPIEDYPLYRRSMLDNTHSWWDSQRWIREHSEMVEQILGRIRSEGPLRSADFEDSRSQRGTWWNWKEEKIALEQLHTAGILMIARREKFQRVYDLAERVLPGWDDRNTPDDETVKRTLALRTVYNLGVAPARWVHDYYRLPKKDTPRLLGELAANGQLITAAVENRNEAVYIHPERLALIETAHSGGLEPALSAVLSPFDPLVWDRARCKALFGFDFALECYLPQEKRKYGYFCLPLLVRGALVGRMDAKAHRKEGRFEIKSLHLEPYAELDDGLAAEIAAAIQRCANWHGTPRVSAARPQDAWAAG